MNTSIKPGWHSRGYLPHFDASCLLQHIVLTARQGTDLTEAPVNRLIEHVLLYFDGAKYDLQAWCIMPDHLHVSLVFYPDHLLGKTIWSWKKWVTTQAKRQGQGSETVFQLDYFDRYVRTLDQAQRLPSYIENNPVKGGLVLDACDWRWSSAWHRAQGWTAKSDLLPVFLPTRSV